MTKKERRKIRELKRYLYFINAARVLLRVDLATAMADAYFFHSDYAGAEATRKVLRNSVICETPLGYVTHMCASTKTVVGSKAKWSVYLLTADGERIKCNLKKITTDPEMFDWAMETPAVRRLLEFITEKAYMPILMN